MLIEDSIVAFLSVEYIKSSESNVYFMPKKIAPIYLNASSLN